jgi:tetratricopeptide (TPR) repeat protein
MSESSTPGTTPASAERVRLLERLLERDTDNPHLFRECAQAALEHGALEVVARICEARLRAHPGDPLARWTSAQALIAREQYGRAAEILEELNGQGELQTAAWQDLGLCYFCMGAYERARAPLEAVYRAGDRSSGLLRLLVSTYHHLGLIAEAAAVADGNGEPARTDAGLAGAYALLYLDLTRPADAARWAKVALALDGRSLDALTVNATLSLAGGDRRRAQEGFDSVLALAPRTGRARIGLGCIALLESDLPRALEHLNRGVELMRDHVGSWHVLAWAYLLGGDLGNAERAFLQALALNRNFAETHGGLAAVAALRGERAAAERGIETALRLDPACLSGQFARSVLAGRGGNAKQAREIVLAAFSRLTRHPGTASLVRNLAAARPDLG